MWEVQQMQFKRQLDAARDAGPHGPFTLEAFYAMALWMLTAFQDHRLLAKLTVAVRTDVRVDAEDPELPLVVRVAHRVQVIPVGADLGLSDEFALVGLVDAVMPYPLMGRGSVSLDRDLMAVSRFCTLSDDAPLAEVLGLVGQVALRLQNAFAPLEFRHEVLADFPDS